jgi:hypothetical protein
MNGNDSQYDLLLALLPDSEKIKFRTTNDAGEEVIEDGLTEYGVYLLCELAGTPEARRFADEFEKAMETFDVNTLTKVKR